MKTNEIKIESTAVIDHLNTMFKKQFKKNCRNGFIYLDVYSCEQLVKIGIVCEKTEKSFLLSLQIFKAGVNFTLDNK